MQPVFTIGVCGSMSSRIPLVHELMQTCDVIINNCNEYVHLLVWVPDAEKPEIEEFKAIKQSVNAMNKKGLYMRLEIYDHNNFWQIRQDEKSNLVDNIHETALRALKDCLLSTKAGRLVKPFDNYWQFGNLDYFTQRDVEVSVDSSEEDYQRVWFIAKGDSFLIDKLLYYIQGLEYDIIKSFIEIVYENSPPGPPGGYRVPYGASVDIYEKFQHKLPPLESPYQLVNTFLPEHRKLCMIDDLEFNIMCPELIALVVAMELNTREPSGEPFGHFGDKLDAYGGLYDVVHSSDVLCIFKDNIPSYIIKKIELCFIASQNLELHDRCRIIMNIFSSLEIDEVLGHDCSPVETLCNTIVNNCASDLYSELLYCDFDDIILINLLKATHFVYPDRIAKIWNIAKVKNDWRTLYLLKSIDICNLLI